MSEPLSIIKSLSPSPMLISWDLGRRCNFDCTYCPAHRHDSTSPHAQQNELETTADFVYKYLSLLMPYRKTKKVSISFTGGEPTIHPKFIDFCKWLRTTYENNYQKQYKLNLSLTSNGATSKAICDAIIENLNFITISYHCEGPERLKEKVLENILYFKKNKFPMKINVMFHANPTYFQECIHLCKFLSKHDIDFVPRMIGEHDDNNKYNHKYEASQLKWMKEFWRSGSLDEVNLSDSEDNNENLDKKVIHKKNARSLGRPCCGKRKMATCSSQNNQWSETSFLSFTKFKNWHCSVNWFFLHIEQQNKAIYHHQTCQARFDGTRGAIGSTDAPEIILNNLKKQLTQKKMPIIVCPNKICGCGLCTPKASELNSLISALPDHIDTSVFENTQ